MKEARLTLFSPQAANFLDSKVLLDVLCKHLVQKRFGECRDIGQMFAALGLPFTGVTQEDKDKVIQVGRWIDAVVHTSISC